jgi:hypothetical protein
MTRLQGKKVVFTGFRDEELKKKIEAAGGKVMSAISKQTDFVVVDGAKGESSAKAQEAKKLGISIMTKKEFTERMFSEKKVGWFQALFGVGDTPKKTKKEKTWNADDLTLSYNNNFLIHDNGGRPFKVLIKGMTFEIFKCKYHDSDDPSVSPHCEYSKVVLKPRKYVRVWIGKDKDWKKFEGNSILFELKPKKYMYVGSEIYTFETDEKIETYASPIYGSDVHYPFALSKSKAYCFLEKTWLPMNLWEDSKDPYDYVYGVHLQEHPKLQHKHTQDLKKKYKIPLKMVHERFDEW